MERHGLFTEVVHPPYPSTTIQKSYQPCEPHKRCSQNLATGQLWSFSTMQGTQHEIVVDKAEFVYPAVRAHAYARANHQIRLLRGGSEHVPLCMACCPCLGLFSLGPNFQVNRTSKHCLRLKNEKSVPHSPLNHGLHGLSANTLI